MIKQAENAVQKYRRNLEKALVAAPNDIKAEVIQDADEFLMDEVRAMDVGRLTSESAAYERFVQRFGTPDQLAQGYLSVEEKVASHSAPSGLETSWLRIVACAVLLISVVSGVCYAMMQEVPIEERSPFTKMEFDDEKILVEYRGKSWQWLEFDEFTVEEITTSAKEHFGDDWQTRIAEDLIKVMAAMDCEVGQTAKLRLRNLETDEETQIAAAPVTHENRRQVWKDRNQDIVLAFEETMRKRAASGGRENNFDQLSPFTKVEFVEDKIMVEFDGKSWQWLGLDDLDVDDIVAYSKEKFGASRWQKRIAEDLVEVLAGMDHEPGRSVALRLLNTESGEEVEIAEAAMTEANRLSVWRNRKDETSEMSTRKVSPEIVQSFHEQLKLRWAYYDPTKTEIEEQVQQATKELAADSSNKGLIELQKVIAKGIDGHASVRGWRLSGKCLPFLIETAGDHYVAVNPNRNAFVDADHPFIDSIDGVSIDDWCQQASVLVANGAPQLVRDRSQRLLRHIDYWRTERGVAADAMLKVTLSSESGESIEKSLSTIPQKPMYGDWPRQESKMLDNEIGYLRIPGMDPERSSAIAMSMKQFKETKGLVVDVRGNGGGTRDALRQLAAYLMSADDLPRVANVAKHRLNPDFGTGHLDSRYLYPEDSGHWSDAEKTAIATFRKDFQPEWDPPQDQFSDWHYMVLNRSSDKDVFFYDKPVVVLMDSGCFSATDIFLAGLKGWRNVTLLGTASGGGSARSVSFSIPDSGIRVKIASMASFQPNGQMYDSNGVQPDEVVQPTAGYFIGREDPVLDRALKIIDP